MVCLRITFACTPKSPVPCCLRQVFCLNGGNARPATHTEMQKSSSVESRSHNIAGYSRHHGWEQRLYSLLRETGPSKQHQKKGCDCFTKIAQAYVKANRIRQSVQVRANLHKPTKLKVTKTLFKIYGSFV